MKEVASREIAEIREARIAIFGEVHDKMRVGRAGHRPLAGSLDFHRRSDSLRGHRYFAGAGYGNVLVSIPATSRGWANDGAPPAGPGLRKVFRLFQDLMARP